MRCRIPIRKAIVLLNSELKLGLTIQKLYCECNKNGGRSSSIILDERLIEAIEERFGAEFEDDFGRKIKIDTVVDIKYEYLHAFPVLARLWVTGVDTILENIFEDTEPIVRFSSMSIEYASQLKSSEIYQKLEYCINRLADIYKDLDSNSQTPLSFIEDALAHK